MTVDLQEVLLVSALICFVLSAVGANTGRINTTALGLAFWVLTVLVR
jgi:hypothetical protein